MRDVALRHTGALCFPIRNRDSKVAGPDSKRLARQPLIGLQVLRLGFGDHLCRQGGCGRGLVPIERLEVIAHELFVKTWLASSRLILVGRPKPRRVRPRDLVNQDHLAIERVQADPYCLAKDIHGIGFKTADQIAQKVGIPPTPSCGPAPG